MFNVVSKKSRSKKSVIQSLHSSSRTLSMFSEVGFDSMGWWLWLQPAFLLAFSLLSLLCVFIVYEFVTYLHLSQPTPI